MDIRKEFALDPNKVRDGVWFNMDAGMPVESRRKLEDLRQKGVACVRVRPLGQMNREYKQRLDDLIRPLRRQRRRGSKSIDDLIEEKVTEAASYDVVVEWFNIEDGGNAVVYSPEEAFRLMIELPELREEWLGYGADLHQFKLEEVAEGAGNSPTPSSMS